MAKADILTLASTLSFSLADSTVMDRLYDDMIQQLGTMPLLFEASVLPVAQEQASFTLPAEAIELVAVLYGDRHLDEASLAELAAVTPTWRSEIGESIAYVRDEEADEDTFRLYPLPALANVPLDVTLGPPFGAGMANQSVIAVYTENNLNPPVWLELPLAFRLLSTEFARDSNHRDPTMAQMCEQMATFLFALLLGKP